MASISLGVATPSDNVRRVSRLIAAQILEDGYKLYRAVIERKEQLTYCIYSR